MACKIHGLKSCKFPSCVNQQAALCDQHLLENCHVCTAIAAGAPPSVLPSLPVVPQPVLPSPKSTISDPHANEVLSAAEDYAQARQDMATIAENVRHLQENLQSAREKLAEAKKNQSAAKKRLAELARGDKTEGE